MQTAQSQGSSDDAEWESRKKIIHFHFIQEDKTCKELRDIMASHYGFNKTLAQYERWLKKKWNMRKYLSHEDWSAIGQLFRKRKLEGKDSELLVDGRPFSSKKTRREIERYAPLFESGTRALVRSPKLSAGITVGTPEKQVISWLRMDNLPFLQFEAFFEAQINAHTLSDHARIFEVVRAENAEPATFVRDTKLLQMRENTKNGPDETGKDILKIALARRIGNTTPTAENLTLALSVIMPGKALAERLGNGLLASSARTASFFCQVVKFIVYLISNSLLKSDEIFERYPLILNGHLLSRLLLCKGPTIDSFAEKLFCYAVETENLKLLQVVLDYGIDPGTMIVHSWSTPLQFAAEEGSTALVKILINSRANLDQLIEDGKALTPLTIAIKYGHSDITEILMKKGASVDPPHSTGSSPLHEAARKLDSTLIEQLLAAGAMVNRCADRGVTALHVAVQYCRESPEDALKTVQRLVERGASLWPVVRDYTDYTDYFEDIEIGDSALDMAARNGCTEIVQLLLSERAPVTKRTLCNAAGSSNSELVQILLDHGADVKEATGMEVDALRAAIDADNPTIIKMLLDRGLDVNNVHYIEAEYPGERIRSLSALQFAVFHKCSNCVQILLDAGADVNALPGTIPKLYAFSWRGLTDFGNGPYNALQIASMVGSEELVRILLTAGAEIHACPSLERPSALFLAIQRNEQAVASILLANPTVLLQLKVPYCHCGEALLQAAIANENTVISNFLLANGVDINAASKRGETALTSAIQKNNVEMIQLLLRLGVDINNPYAKSMGITALEAASAKNDTALVRSLLDMGANPNDPNALVAAIANSVDPALIGLLLTARASLPGQGGSNYGLAALQVAIEMQDLSMTRILIGAGVDVNSRTRKTYGQDRWNVYKQRVFNGETALWTAIRTDKTQNFLIVELLLSAGADPNTTTDDRIVRRAPLQAAAEAGNLEIVQVLLQYGADVNASAYGRYGHTALQAAAKKGNLEIVQVLLAAGADVNGPAAAFEGATALQFAVIYGHAGIARILLDAGADVNAAGSQEDGRTALEAAAEHDRLELLQLLLNAGALLHGPGEKQYTNAVEYATEEGHMAIAKVLRSFKEKLERDVEAEM